MTFDEFSTTLTQADPPANLSPVLLALWQDAKGRWHEAHEIAQSREGIQEYDQLHAYLHRKEGDSANARYWYRRARVAVFTESLADEWQVLAKGILNV
jgi:hypothetical protein